jgi:hypothetical protein
VLINGVHQIKSSQFNGGRASGPVFTIVGSVLGTKLLDLGYLNVICPTNSDPLLYSEFLNQVYALGLEWYSNATFNANLTVNGDLSANGNTIVHSLLTRQLDSLGSFGINLVSFHDMTRFIESTPTIRFETSSGVAQTINGLNSTFGGTVTASGFASTALDSQAITSVGWTNSTGKNAVVYLTAATALELHQHDGSTVFSGYTIVAPFTVYVQAGGWFIGTGITGSNSQAF